MADRADWLAGVQVVFRCALYDLRTASNQDRRIIRQKVRCRHLQRGTVPKIKLNDATHHPTECLRPVRSGAWVTSFHFSEKVRVRSGVAKGRCNDTAFSIGVLQIRNEVLGLTRDYICDESLRQLCDSRFGCG